MASSLIFIACLVALCGISSSSGFWSKDGFDGHKSEKDLRRHLFQNYDKLVRPVRNSEDAINVSLGITPLNIRSLDEKSQYLTLETFTLMRWTDEFLKWDSKRFGNMTVLRVPATEVWRPDFAVYGSPDATAMFPVPNTNVLIYENGMVLWVPMFTIKTKCPVLKPWKKVITCNIKIGSWTFSEDILDIQLATKQVDMSDFLDINHDWKLMKISQDRQSKIYPCCVEVYPNLNFNVTLSRRNEISATKDQDTMQEVDM